MQQEIANLNSVINPESPFYCRCSRERSTTRRSGPLYAIYDKVDKLILGGVIYNAFLCAKYGVRIEGVSDKDITAARELVEKDRLERQNYRAALPC